MKLTSLKKSVALLSLSVALLVGSHAVGGSYSYGNSSKSAPVTKQETSLGTVWATSEGMTLYTFDMDNASQSNCNGGCARAWPPLIAGDSAKASGSFSLITRKDGSKQWAVNGNPLYTWIKDQKVGDTTGDGVKGVWHAAFAK